MENELFKMEKIKKLTEPIDLIQGNLQSLKDESEDFDARGIEIEIKGDSLDEEFKQIESIIKDIKETLVDISNRNINQFLNLKEHLISKYKESFNEKLKRFGINSKKTKEIGLKLIDRKEISIIIKKVSYISSLGTSQWLDLTDSLKNNSLFQSSVRKISDYYDEIIKKKLSRELEKIPEHIDEVIITEFKKQFLQDPSINFTEFYDNLKAELTKKDIEDKSKIIKKIREEEKLQKLKEELEKQLKSSKSSYQDYFKYSEREFERRRRRKRRGKLSELQDAPSKEREISDEVAEKINKFKSKLDRSFRKKYMKEEEEEKSPLDIVRERKEKKRKEYKKYKDSIQNRE
ncbi:MAG: hypothetical protein ACOC44_08490 [Promethearchaeia archaeon]